MPYINDESYLDQVSRGISGHKKIHIKAKCQVVAETETTMWFNSTSIDYLTSASYLRVSSDQVADDEASTGAQRVYIEGLASSHTETSESIWLKGQTPVTTTNQYIRVNYFKVSEVGTVGHNTGTIFLWDDAGSHTTGTPSTTTKMVSMIAPKEREAYTGVYTLPVNKYGYLLNVWSSGAGGKSAVRIKFGNFETTTNAYLTQKEIYSEAPCAIESKVYERNYGRGDYEIRIEGNSAGTYKVMAGMELLIVDYDAN